MEHASQTEGRQTQPASAALRSKSATMTDHSPGGDRLRGLGQLINGSPAVQRLQSVSDSIQRQNLEEEELVQAKSAAPAPANKTGLPANLKSGIESLSGLSMDHVQVHRNSSRPAQLNAHAFAQGSDIHLAPGQDQHLPHEAWHVVQQAQGRVKPTMQLKGGVQINDDAGLEREADVMGARALAAPLQAGGITQRANSYSTQSPTGNAPLAQRVATIGEETYTHGSKKMNSLFLDVVAPQLSEAGYKLYGLKSQLVTFVRDFDTESESPDIFVQKFIDWVSTQVRKTKGEKTTPVLKKFTVEGMSRPKWPEEYAALLGVQLGDNIRHVVRNATLKRALQAQDKALANKSMQAKTVAFGAIASQIGIEVNEDSNLETIVRAIYDKAYLNRKNLFSGEGPTNQIIGLASDGIKSLGQDLLAAGDGSDLVAISAVEKEVFRLVFHSSEMVRAEPNYKLFVIHELTDVIRSAFQSLYELYGESSVIPRDAVGDLVEDIGLNFGFDLIDGRVDEDMVDIGERQANLIEVEMALNVFIASDGTEGSLGDILHRFLN